jgi:hypothetical protein
MVRKMIKYQMQKISRKISRKVSSKYHMLLSNYKVIGHDSIKRDERGEKAEVRKKKEKKLLKKNFKTNPIT